MPCFQSFKHIFVAAGLAALFLSLLVPQQVQGALLHPADDTALVALYNATGGASWIDNTGWFGTTGMMNTASNPPYGVSFDAGGRVTRVSLSNNNLAGDISALDWSGMSSLTWLVLSRNQLKGTAPAATQLPLSIQQLVLWGNQLSGAVPDYSLLDNLTQLNLGDNAITGPLPTAAQLPPNVQFLYLYSNQLSGAIPDYSTLKGVSLLHLSNNQLSGGLPPAAQLPPNLASLYAAGNQLGGSLPAASQLPAGIRVLMLQSNPFTAGPVPDYSSLASLAAFSLENTQRSGTLPTAAQLPPSIANLWLGSNALTGSIPDYGSLASLTNLQVPFCQLSGTLPTAQQLPANLRTLNLGVNQLSGAIPDYSVLSSLQYLYLNHNQLTGGLPPVNTLPAGLVQLYLDSNLFGGAIVDYSAIASLTTLQLQYLNIQGPTPSALLSWTGDAFFTTTPVIDPALDGSSQLQAPLTVSGTGAEPGGTVELLLDGVTELTGIGVDGLGTWSTTLDLSTQAKGSHTLTAVTRFDNWSGYAAGQASTVPSAAVSIDVVVDTTPPVISLLGDNPMIVAHGGAFSDPGATVTDDFDTGLTATVTGSVDVNTVGSYTLTYTAADSSGNAATPVTRTVNVVAATSTHSGGGGGGSMGLEFLLLMLLFYARRRAYVSCVSVMYSSRASV